MDTSYIHRFGSAILFIGARDRAQAFGSLGHDGQTHRNVKPIQNMLRFRVDELRQIADILAPIREERDLLIHLHVLASQQFE